MSSTWRWHASALALYSICAWLSIVHGASFTRTIAGGGTDPLAFIWCLSWWPWALAHHQNPFFTTLLWQPAGLNLGWTTAIPFLAFLALPITLLSGPVLAFNLLNFAAPVLAAYAVFMLCDYLTSLPSAALIGGFLFGFSSYQMSRQSEQLNLEFTALIPCFLMIILARLDNRISRKTTIAAAALVLVGQFATSLEVFATSLLCGTFVWSVAYWQLPARRPVLIRLLQDGLMTAPIVLLLLSPMLWAMFTLPRDFALPRTWPALFSTDLLNLVIPTRATLLGGQLALPFSRHFPGFMSEQSGYLGLPLVFILWTYLRQGNKFLALSLVGIIVASLGPRLWLGGIPTGIPLPWALIQRLPLINNALPSRLMLFADLIASIIAALWIAQSPRGRQRYFRMFAGGLAALCLFPASHGMQPVPYSPFFAPGRLQSVLGFNRRILVLLFGIFSPVQFWQVENQFGFALTGGYLGFPPKSFQADPLMMQFFFGIEGPRLVPDFITYCEKTGTEFIVAGPGSPQHLMAAIKQLSWPVRQVDDVTIFTVPSESKLYARH